LSLRGTWDLPHHCPVPVDDSTSRIIIRKREAVFWELVFTPQRVLTAAPSNWTATGTFDEEGKTSKGRHNLRLSPDGSTLAYTDSGNRLIRLVRCAKQR